jgi:predicted Zn-dependent peptidase
MATSRLTKIQFPPTLPIYMKYISLTPTVHILLESLDRKKTNVEIILTSGGSWFETDEDRGRRHLLEHCILSRTPEMNFQQFKDYTFRENIYTNAYTGPQTMGFEASGHHGDTHKMLKLLLDVVFTPTFDQPDLEREREIVLREISERRGDPNYKLHFDTMKEVYTPDSAENHETLGNSEQVKTTSTDDFIRMNTENLEKSHLIVSLSGGGIDEKEIISMVETEIGRQTFNENQTKLPIDFKLKSQLKNFTVLPIIHPLAHEHAEVTMMIDCPVNRKNDAHLKLFNTLYLQYGGILYDRLRDELKLVYGIGSTFSINHQKLMINFSCEIQYINQIIKEIKTTFSDFDTYFKPQKFDEFKQVLHKKQEISEDTLGSSTNLALALLRNYGVFEDIATYNERIMNTSIEDIKAIYENLKKGLPLSRVVIVSKDEEIRKLQ